MTRHVTSIYAAVAENFDVPATAIHQAASEPTTGGFWELAVRHDQGLAWRIYTRRTTV